MVEIKACDTHNKIGKIVRKAIEQAGRNYARRLTLNKGIFLRKGTLCLNIIKRIEDGTKYI